jgi:uncharacterized lipoprotein YmbA
MTRAWRYCRLAGLGLAAMLAACSSPAPMLYTIAPVDGAARAGAPRIVVLQRVGLERYLDRSQIVRSSENYRLDVMSNDWWGEPLGAMLARVLIAELSQRLPQSTVLAETGAVSAAPDATVEVNVQRLDANPAGSIVLEAQADVQVNGQKAVALRTFHIVVRAPTPDVPGQVAATSTALGQLADGIAGMLLKAPAPR